MRARPIALEVLATGLVVSALCGAPVEGSAEPASSAGPTSSPESAAAASELAAGRIQETNFETAQVGGPDADAGVGDWYLRNGTICAAVSDPTHESPLSPRGGVLIDLGHCGRNDDQWSVFQPLLNLSQSEVVPVDSILSGAEGDRAWLRTRAVYNGVEILTTYAVDRATPNALAVEFRAKRITSGDRLFGLGAIALHASGQLASFSVARGDLASSRGFVHPANDRSSTRRLLASLVDSDLTVLVAGDETPTISYCIERVGATLAEAGIANPLSSFTITGGHYTLIAALARPPWLGTASGRPGLLQLGQIPFMDLDEGEILAVDYRLWVGARAAVASVTDQIFAVAGEVRGRVDDPEARVHALFGETGAPVSEVAPDRDGRYALRLPAGRYRLEARARAGRSASVTIEVPASASSTASSTASIPAVEAPPLVVGATGRVALPEGFIGHLVFLKPDGTRLRFGESLLGFRVGEAPVPNGLEAEHLNVVPGSARDVEVPPGHYRVLAVRGPEYAAGRTEIDVRAGEIARLALAPLARVAPTPGWIGADLHVHSGQSFDSSVPERRQIEAFAASGAEVLVSTEHDRIFDPRREIEASGLAGEVVGVTGSELTSAFAGGDSPFTAGHLNAFPLPFEPRAFRRGAIALEGRRLRNVLSELRARAQPPLVQLNHPRPHPDGGDVDAYFNHLAVAGEPLDPTRPLAEWPNSVLIERGPANGGRDLDVDAMELLNASDMTRFRRTRADWLSFQLQGERIVATANSDSHRLGHVVGLPRNYVRVADDRVDAFDEPAFVASLRAGRAYGTTGPLLVARLDQAEIGELHAGTKGVLAVSVAAAEWVPISTWRAYVNGELVHEGPISRGESARLPLAFERDAFVTVEVEGPSEGLYRDVLPEFTPFAFSNPIFVDADGDGRFRAPGLPPRNALPETITRPDPAP